MRRHHEPQLYIVDGERHRIWMKRDGQLVQGFVYADALRVMAELDGSGAVVARFIYGDGVNVPDVMIKGGVTYRIFKDHLGSPRLVVDVVTGAIAQRIDYDAFGNVGPEHLHQPRLPALRLRGRERCPLFPRVAMIIVALCWVVAPTAIELGRQTGNSGRLPSRGWW